MLVSPATSRQGQTELPRNTCHLSVDFADISTVFMMTTTKGIQCDTFNHEREGLCILHFNIIIIHFNII